MDKARQRDILLETKFADQSLEWFAKFAFAEYQKAGGPVLSHAGKSSDQYIESLLGGKPSHRQDDGRLILSEPGVIQRLFRFFMQIRSNDRVIDHLDTITRDSGHFRQVVCNALRNRNNLIRPGIDPSRQSRIPLPADIILISNHG